MELEHRDLSSLLETAIVAARLAGQRAMEEINYIKISVKNSNELVTQADARCQKIIIDRIKENYPDHGFIAEEGDEGQIFKQPPLANHKLRSNGTRVKLMNQLTSSNGRMTEKNGSKPARLVPRKHLLSIRD